MLLTIEHITDCSETLCSVIKMHAKAIKPHKRNLTLLAEYNNNKREIHTLLSEFYQSMAKIAFSRQRYSDDILSEVRKQVKIVSRCHMANAKGLKK